MIQQSRKERQDSDGLECKICNEWELNRVEWVSLLVLKVERSRVADFLVRMFGRTFGEMTFIVRIPAYEGYRYRWLCVCYSGDQASDDKKYAQE